MGTSRLVVTKATRVIQVTFGVEDAALNMDTAVWRPRNTEELTCANTLQEIHSLIVEWVARAPLGSVTPGSHSAQWPFRLLLYP